jgi:UDP-glucose 4-epimerase
MAKIIVTGGAGFVGSHLVDRLVGEGEQVTVVDDMSNGRTENLSNVLDKISLHKLDVSDPNTVQTFFDSGVNEIFHLACYPRSISFSNPLRDCQTNLMSTINILKLAEHEDAKIVFSSNTGIVSNPETLPVDESAPPNPVTPYDVHKYASELMLRAYSKTYGTKSVILRFASVYGPRQRVNEDLGWTPLIPEFAGKIKRDIPPAIPGDGTQTRDFIYVSDIVEGLLAAMRSDISNAEMFILGTGVETSVIEAFRMICRLMGSNVTPRFEAARVDDIKKMRYSFSKAMRLLRWRPKTSIEDGLRRTIQQFVVDSIQSA